VSPPKSGYMMGAEFALGILLLLTGPAALLASQWVRQQRLGLRNAERRVVAFASELGHARAAQVRLDSLRDQMSETLDASSRAVRETHRAIADIPFSILESIPATRGGARQLRRIHDLASDGIYTGISLLARWQRSRKKLADNTRRAIESGDDSPI